MILLPTKESQTVEFKSSFNMETIETLVAFANSKGGTVYVGVSDSGKILGITLATESLQHWVNEIKGKTEPSLVPEVEVVEMEGKCI